MKYRSLLLSLAILLTAAFSCSAWKQTGWTKINVDGGYRTCGGECGSPTHDSPNTQEWCTSTKECTDNAGCDCHMYDSKGETDKKKWKHVWAPGDVKPSPNADHRCLCVKARD